MSLIEMLPAPLQQKIRVIPDAENFVIQTLDKAANNYNRQKQIRSVRGKYKSVPTDSETFARRKQQETEIER